MKEDAAKKVAKQLRKIAAQPKAERLLLMLPENRVGLPAGEFILGPYLRFIAEDLEG